MPFGGRERGGVIKETFQTQKKEKQNKNTKKPIQGLHDVNETLAADDPE